MARKQGQAAGVNVSASSEADHCLCTVNVTAQGALPRIYVDVRPESECQWERLRSVVDMCSTRTLMDTGCADTLRLVVKSDASMTSLVALDGKPLHVRGTAVIQLQRLDGSVHLPCTKVTAVIVDSLAVVASSLLISADVISGAGGVRLEYGDDNKLSGVTFGKPEVVAATLPTSHPLPHVRVEQRGDDVIFSTDDGQVKWDSAA